MSRSWALALGMLALCQAPARSQTIQVDTVPRYAALGFITGTVTGVDFATHHVATYIHIEGSGWWTKPTSTDPTVPIDGRGGWTADVGTGGSESLDSRAVIFCAALLRDDVAPPVALGSVRIPATLAALALDCHERHGRTLSFAGRTWAVKEAPFPVGPGPNRFSDRSEDVFVDAAGLHLRVAFHDGHWWSSELILLDRLGYGIYAVQTNSRTDILDANVTFGIFTWDPYADDDSIPAWPSREIDFEDSRWGHALDPENAQMVVQPYDVPGNLRRYTLPDLSSDARLTRIFDWRAGRIDFLALLGHHTPTSWSPGDLIDQWSYTHDPLQSHLVPPAGRESLRLNLWLGAGKGAPASGQPVEVVVSDVRFVPALDTSTSRGVGAIAILALALTGSRKPHSREFHPALQSLGRRRHASRIALYKGRGAGSPGVEPLRSVGRPCGEPMSLALEPAGALVDFDPLRPLADPYPVYRRLRDEAPVHHSPERGVFSVTRFDDVMHVLKTPEIFSSRAMFTMLLAGGSEKLPPLSWGFVRFLVRMVFKVRLNPLEFRTARNLIAEDGESHASMRSVVNRGFTPRRIAAWETRIRGLVRECMAPLQQGGGLDVMRDLAVPVPVTVIAEMLGVPRERLADFKRWSDLVVSMATGPDRENPFRRPVADGIIEILTYTRALARERRQRPQDDLISTIVAEQAGETALSDREVVQFVLLLLVAGNETTTNLIGNVVNALFDHPEQARKVAANPGLVPALVEEGLRYDTPVQVVFRTTTADTEIRGVRIPERQFVAAFLGSANRDERRFEDADRLDVTRRPQGFPGFGFGKHFCLGASLARLEARLVLEALVPELAKLERADPQIERVDSFLVRGPKRLALRPRS